LTDDHEITQRYPLKAHAPSFQCSFLRKVSKYDQPLGCRNRTLCSDRRTAMRSPCSSEASDCMSKLALASRPDTSSMPISTLSGNTMGRFDRVCGAIG